MSPSEKLGAAWRGAGGAGETTDQAQGRDPGRGAAGAAWATGGSQNTQSPGAQHGFLQQARASALPRGPEATGPNPRHRYRFRDAKGHGGLETPGPAALTRNSSQATSILLKPTQQTEVGLTAWGPMAGQKPQVDGS